MQGKIKQKGLFRVSVYFNEREISALARQAENLQFRRVGLPIKKLKAGGFADEWEANTDGISKTLKFFADYYGKTEPRRLAELAALSREEQEIKERKAKAEREAGISKT